MSPIKHVVLRIVETCAATYRITIERECSRARRLTLWHAGVLETGFDHLDRVILQVEVDLHSTDAVLFLPLLVHGLLEVAVVRQDLSVNRQQRQRLMFHSKIMTVVPAQSFVQDYIAGYTSTTNQFL